MIIEALAIGWAVVVGAKTANRTKGLDCLRNLRQQLKSRWAAWTASSTSLPTPESEIQHANQLLILSWASLGMTVAGLALAQPWLSLAGVPLALVVFAPTFRSAYQTLRHERRIDNQVLDATRVALCVVLRYDTITAMNALLQAGSQKFFAQSEADFRRQIEALPWTGDVSSLVLQDVLTNAAAEKSNAQADGEANARRMAPWMMACFALSWPILGPNRAAAFLTTGFGAHLRTLGPFTARNTVLAAAQSGIVIKNVHALEAAAQIDTLVLDARLLRDDGERASLGKLVAALRSHPALDERANPFAVYLLIEDGDAADLHPLAADIAFDGFIDRLSSWPETNPLDLASLHGRAICYLGPGSEDRAACMAHATLPVVWGNPEAITDDSAQVVLLGDDPTVLLRLLELAATFSEKQRFNLRTPIGFDLVDIGTTIFVHLGLSYSVLFNFAGLATAAVYAGKQSGGKADTTESRSNHVQITFKC